jgi:peptide/nickel transport system substrate-binding protein
MKRALIALLVLSALVGLLGGHPQVDADEPLRIAMPAIPKSPDPNRDPGGQMLPVYRLVFEGLTKPDESGQPIPVLAESWKLLNDTTWQFTLRRGVRFSDGEPFTADVVKWNIERAQNPKNSVYSARVKPIVTVEIVNEYTVVIKTQQPFASLLGNLMPILMLPPKYYQKVGPQGFATAPVGTGPYRVVEFTPDATIRMERNESYWGSKPRPTGVTFRMLPEAATRVAALQAGEVDVVYHVPPENVDQLKGAGMKVFPVQVGQALMFILAQPKTTIEPLRNKLVRQAINYAVDKDTIIKAFTKGMARKLEGQVVGPDGFGYTDKVKAYPYDPAKAKALLKEAGYPNGFKVKMSGTNGRYPEDKEVSQAVAQYLRQVGIDVELSLLEANVWTDRYLNYKFDPIWIIGVNYLPSMDHTFASVHFTGEPGSRQMIGDDKLDDLYRKQVSTLDINQRRAALERFAEYLREQAVALFLHQLPVVIGTGPRVKGLKFHADYTIDLTNAQVGR